MNTVAIKLAGPLGENTVDFIRGGYARTVQEALAYQIQKMGMTIGKTNITQRQAEKNELDRLKEYNNGNEKYKGYIIELFRNFSF